MAEKQDDSFIDNLRITPQQVIPDLCDVKNLFIAILLTIILSISFALASADNSQSFWEQVSQSTFLMLWISLINIALLCRLRRRLHDLGTRRCLIVSFLLMMAVSALVATLAVSFSRYSAIFDVDTSNDTVLLFYVRVLALSAVIYLVLLRYFYIQFQWRRNMLAQSQARIQSLRARIRPHFLFNSMNTIASLIETDPNKAEQAVEDLSELFRASLGDHDLNPLSEELELTRSYLAIEGLRLGDRLSVDWQIDEDVLPTMVPALILQPLVENAIYHGIEPMVKGGKILISLLKVGERLELSVSNPVDTTDRPYRRRKGNQMAQDNIQQRLDLVYGSSAGFSINDTKDHYTVTIMIPLGARDECADR